MRGRQGRLRERLPLRRTFLEPRLGGMSRLTVGSLLIAPKVHFLNSALSEECPECGSGQNRIDAAPLSGMDRPRAGGERTPDSVQR